MSELPNLILANDYVPFKQYPLIGFTGRAGSGKDTAADYLVEHFSYYKLTFANPIKLACKELYGFTHDELYGDKKNITNQHGFLPRLAFTQLGDMCRNQDPEFFIKRLNIDLIPLLNKNVQVVISDVRFPDEIKFIKENKGIVIGLQRDTVLPHSLAKHPSEIIHIDQSDYIIHNNKSINELYKQIDSIMSML